MAKNKNSEAKSSSQFTFNCDKRLWVYWERILPHLGYAEHGISTDALIDDAVAFACYCLSEYENFPTRPAAYNFRSCLWDAMTGFESLSGFTHDVSERIDEHLRNRRVQQLYLEFFVRSRANEGTPAEDIGGGYWTKRSRADEFPSFPVHEGFFKIPTPLYSHLTLEDLRESVSCALIFNYLGSQEVSVSLTKPTSQTLANYLGRFQMSGEEALLIILSSVQKFMPLNSVFSDSFRADLLDRYLACKTLVLRWLDQLAIFESLASEGDEYARILVERLAVLNKRLQSGQSLLDYMADDPFPRGGVEVDNPQMSKLNRYERLGGGGML